jgi:uracil phosphoribosyltransferase
MEVRDMTVFEVKHPLIEHKLGLLRSNRLKTKEFREITSEIASLLTYEATKDLELEEKKIKGWAEEVSVKRIKGRKLVIVPILRAGVGMLDGLLNMIPSAKVNFVGLYRDHDTLEAIQYYSKLSRDIEDRMALIVDPMLATANTIIKTIEILKKAGCRNIKALCLVGAPEGINKLEEKHPDVDVYLASRDRELNDIGYILPGLGDAGDRLFGTK